MVYLSIVFLLLDIVLALSQVCRKHQRMESNKLL